MREKYMTDSNFDKMRIKQFQFTWYRLSKKKYVFIFFAITINLLDLLGVIMIASIGTYIPDSRSKENLITQVIDNVKDRLQLNQYETIYALTLIGLLFLILRSFVNLILSRNLSFYLGKQMKLLSTKITDLAFKEKLHNRDMYTSQDVFYQATYGTYQTIIVLGYSIIYFISDLVLLTILISFSLWYSASLTLSLIIILACSGVVLQKYIRPDLKIIGNVIASSNIVGNRKIGYLHENFKNLYASGEINLKLLEIESVWNNLGKARGKQIFSQQFPKVFIEFIFLLSVGLILFLQVSKYPNEYYVVLINVGTFLIIGTRLIPAFIRLNNGLIAIRTSTIEAKKLVPMINAMEKSVEKHEENIEYSSNENDLKIKMLNMSFGHSSGNELYNNLTLSIPFGDKITFVGDSGSGKSTLLDLILGLRSPSSGKVTISGLPPSVFLKLNVGKVSYLSQNYVLDEGSIRFNITNKNTSENEDRKLWEILKIVELHDFVKTLPENLEYLVGQHNSKISGGQKQKIGLAKALYKDPEILILDEATNSIDSKSETIILNNILNLNYKQTLIYISHNLRTHELFEKTFYINSMK